MLSIKSEKDTAKINHIFYLKEIYGQILRYLISICSYLYMSIFSGIQSAGHEGKKKDTKPFHQHKAKKAEV